MRYALYYVPAPDTPLYRAGSTWLGHDVYAGPGTRPIEARQAGIVQGARRYGFHATLKAPFRLRRRRCADDLCTALGLFAAGQAPITVGSMKVAQLDRFVALVPKEPCGALDALAAQTVAHFDLLRGFMSDAEVERRRRAGLTPRQERLLARWGYPYVFDEFRFHLSLTGDLATEPARDLVSELEARFAGVLDSPVCVDRIALCVEDRPGAAFRVHSSYRLGEPAGSALDVAVGIAGGGR
jgi:putative phosphonate metabolism protein